MLSHSSSLSSNSIVAIATATGTMLSAMVDVAISVIADGTAPKFSKMFYDVSMQEDAAVGTVLIVLSAEGNEMDLIYQIQTSDQVSACTCKQI